MTKPQTIHDYIQSKPEEAQLRLQEMLDCLRDAAPNAEESLKWGKPALSYDVILFIFAAYKKHISLHPHPRSVEAFSEELVGYERSENTIKFPLNNPLPTELIGKIARFRVREAQELGIQWK